VSFIAGLIIPALVYQGNLAPEWNNILLENVQTTIESALAGLLFFALVYGAFRFLRQRVTPAAILFILTVEIVLIGALPVPFFAPLRQFTDWLLNVPVNAGARGILLGIALATLLTGLRVLIGQDRTYGE
jgi:zinc transporter ZupT